MRRTKKILAILLCATAILTSLPTTASHAAEPEDEKIEITQDDEDEPGEDEAEDVPEEVEDEEEEEEEAGPIKDFIESI